MSIRDLGVLLLKLWGLVCLVSGAVAALQLLLPSPGEEGLDRFTWMIGGLGAVTSIALGAVLLISAEGIVSFILPREVREEGAVATTYTAAEWQSLVFGGVGAYFAVDALRDIARLSYTLARGPKWDPSGAYEYALRGYGGELAGAVVQLIAAVVVLAGRRGLAAIWARVHPMGSS